MTPEQFWRLSVRELMVLAGNGQAAPLSRENLSSLMTQFPDFEE